MSTVVHPSFNIENFSSNLEVKITNFISTTYNNLKNKVAVDSTPSKSSTNIKLFFIGLLAVLSITLIIITLPITYPLAILLYKDLAKKISNNKNDAIKHIHSSSFDKIKQMEMHLDKTLKIFQPLENDLEKIKDKFLFRSIAKDYITINSNLNELKQECIKQYTFSEADMLKYLTKEEFEEYKKTFESFNDIWDYPTTDKEYQMVFDHKKSIS